jgi:DNA-binding phage protein
MLREDGALAAPENLTDDEAKLKHWNVQEYLCTEEEIRAYLDEALKDAPDDAPF